MKSPLKSKFIALTLSTLAFLVFAQLADAGWGRRGRRQQVAYAQACPSQQFARSPSGGSVTPPYPSPVVTPSVGGASDVGLGWINAVRARVGIRPLGYDPAMGSVAANNNAHQRSRGLGHWFRGDTRQNAGMGPLDAIQSLWLASGAHAAAIFDPNITVGAVAYDGQFATFSAR